MNDISIKLYEDIKLCSRYKNIVLNNKIENRDDRLKNADKDKVLEIFKELGFKATFNTKEKFYKVKYSESDYNFYYHIDIRSGIYELIFGVVNKKSKKHLLGGTIPNVYDDILRSKRIEEKPMSLPSFGTYENLKSILKDSLSLYEDFKSAVLEMQP